MYNIYTYEKKQKELLKKQQEKSQEEKIKHTRQRQLSELAKSYDHRIKSFVYDMVNSPVMVKPFEDQDINLTTRKLYQDELKKKMKLSQSNNKFIFKRFQTDRERIEAQMRSYPSFCSSRNNNKEKASMSTKDQKRISYLQPSMRFKNRTDLERIYDTVNSNQLGRIPKEIIDQQLSLLRLNKPVIIKEDSDDVLAFSKIKEILEARKINIEKNRKENKTETQIKRKSRKIVDNSQAKKILEEFHVKTHFKAASMFSLNLMDDEGYSTVNRLGREKMKNKSHRNLMEIINPRDNSQDKDDVSDRNGSFYDLDYNPLLKKSTVPYDKHQLEYLKQISASPTLKPEEPLPIKKIGFIEALKERRNALSALKSNPISFFENYNPDSRMPLIKPEEEKVVIGDKVFYKSEVDKISKLVLKNCNFTHTKSEFNNTRLKIGDGRLMITNGMTVSEFAKKFHLPK